MTYQVRVCSQSEWSEWLGGRSEADAQNAGVVVIGHHPTLGVVLDCAGAVDPPGRLYHAGPNRHRELPQHVRDVIVEHHWGGE